jgi:hypothetical protein
MAKSSWCRHALAVLGACVGLFLLTSQSRADGVSFDSPTGDIGSTTHTYTLDGISIVATAFDGGDLFGKNSGVGEQGVGLAADPTGQHEIFATTGTRDFIQLDLLNLINAGFTNFEFQMGSTTGAETWQVTACSTAGIPGSGPCAANAFTETGSTETIQIAPANLSATNHFLDFSSLNGNVLLGQIAATPTVPEPSSFMLLLTGIVALAGIFVLKGRPD